MMSRVLVCLIIFCSAVSYAQSPGKVMVAAASDLKFALDSIIAVYHGVTPGVSVDVAYGSSGKLFEQITNGAPFDIYFSADRDYPLQLKSKGRLISEVRTYGFGRIVLWTRSGNVKDLESYLLQPKVRKVAVANPLHAPYGRSAIQALKFYGIHDRVETKLVYGENVSQAAQFVTSGAADAGIIALSLALSPPMRRLNRNYFVIPAESYAPLEQAYAVLDNARGNTAVIQFEKFLQTPQAREIFAYFGFSPKP